MKDNKFGFIGLGLIGGSIAKALKASEPSCTIYAYMRTRSTLELARSEGIVDVLLDSVDSKLSECDVIFLCTPVEYSLEYLSKLKDIIVPGTLITDVGSTKTSIHEAVSSLGMEDVFIGGHPMAGSEKVGYEQSDSLLLENAYYMITPTPSSTDASVSRIQNIATSIGAIPLIIDYKTHDKVTATISHVPHLIAAALVELVRCSDDDTHIMQMVAAGGFKDITRIASSSPVMWEQICDTNREAILSVLIRYIDSLNVIKEELINHDNTSIHDLFLHAGEYRKHISDEGKGLMNAQYSLSVHVADRPGSISIISAILAASGISIKNIGINHNRELGEGALLISFYDSDSCEYAKKQLLNYDYKLSRS